MVGMTKVKIVEASHPSIMQFLNEIKQDTKWLFWSWERISTPVYIPYLNQEIHLK